MRRHAKASTAGSTQRQAGRLGLACLAIAALAALLGTGASSAVAAEECPNEVRRQEQGIAALALPDCRAFENASPGSKPVQIRDGGAEPGLISISGNAAAYRSRYPAEGADRSGETYLTTRGPIGWSTRPALPQESPGTAGNTSCLPTAVFSPDFSREILIEDKQIFLHANNGFPEGFCEHNEEVLDPREKPGFTNFFLRNTGTGPYELLNSVPEGIAPGNAGLLGASDDFKQIYLSSEAQLTPEAPGVTPGVEGGWNVFVWSAGVIRLVTFLPDGTPVAGVPANAELPPTGEVQYFSPQLELGDNTYENPISNDGSKFFFTAGGKLYVRLNPFQPPSAISGGECTEPTKACTVEVDETQGSGASGGAHFEFASEDGSRVFFTSDHRLTADSTAVAGKEDLYEFDLETEVLSDLTVSAGEPAGVWAVSGWSEDGSRVYFVAEAALAPGALAGDCATYGASHTCNLYVWDEGTTRFVAALSVNDYLAFKATTNSVSGSPLMHHERFSPVGAQASPNGRYFTFFSNADLTGHGPGLYLYDAAAEQVNYVAGGVGAFTIRPAATYVLIVSYGWRRNQVTDSGQVFFTSSAALVPADSNEAADVYEYKDNGAYLLSGGTYPGGADLVGANPSGSDVFFVAAAGLLASDTDGAINLYDVRVDGGFAEPPPLPGCEAEACRGAGTVALSNAATGTAAFQGAGNLKQVHKRDCGIAAKRALEVSRAAKRLRRKAKQTQDPSLAKRLRLRSAKLAKQSRQLSKGAKRCRRANRRVGK